MTVSKADLDAAQADILAKVNDRFTALGKLVTPDPVPPPPITSSEILLATNWFTPDLPNTSLGFDDYVLQEDAQFANRVRTVKDAGGIVARYATPVAKRPSDPNGYTQVIPPGYVPAGWLYKNPDGTTIYRSNNGGEWFINPGDPGFIAAAVPWLVNSLKASGVNSVMIDEVNFDPKWSFPAANLNEVRYRDDFVQFLRALGSAARSAGKSVGVNLGSNYWVNGVVESWAERVMAEVQYVSIEQFVGRRGASPATLADQWLPLMKFLQWNRVQGKWAQVNVADQSPAVAKYALLSLMLVSRNVGQTGYLDAFGWQPSGNGASLTLDPALMSQVDRLGAPTAEFTLSNGVATRPFQNGNVVVYPTLTKYSQSYITILGP